VTASAHCLLVKSDTDRSLTQRFSNSAEYSLENINIEHFIHRLTTTDHFLVYTDVFEENGLYVVASAALRGRPRLIRDILLKAYNVRRPPPDNYESSEADDYDEPAYLLILSPSDPFMWQGFVMMLTLPEVDLNLDVQRVRLVADGTEARLAVAKSHFTSVFFDDTSDSSSTTDSDENRDNSETARNRSRTPVHLHCIIEQQAHLPNVNRELHKISRATNKLAETIVGSVNQVREALQGSEGYQELLENWYTFASDHGQHAQKHIEPGSFSRFARMLTKLAISWVAFICDDCDPTDRKTFRWAVTALEFAMTRTHGTNILHLPDDEFALLRQKVATCMTLLISHFDILGARSSYEASKEQERLAELRRMEGMMNQSLNGGGVGSRPVSPVSETIMENQSLRLRWKEPLSKMEELEARRYQAGSQQRNVGRVVDEEKLEDKSLLFLASSTSNISIRWQQGRFIGSGAFGSVYLAVNLDSGGLMAAKEIKFQDMTHLSNLYQQIKDELSVMEILQHPNIIEYYGIEVHRDRVFIFEEYCPGGSLATLLEHGRIEDESVLQVYTMQMLDGLAYLHSQGVVHRDIKPDSKLCASFDDNSRIHIESLNRRVT
jgi:mitogen-activated protein kinase kinase kinase